MDELKERRNEEVLVQGERHGTLEPASTAQLLREILSQSSELIRKELALARTEFRSSVQNEIRMAQRMAVAGVTAFYGVGLLLATLVLALAEGLPGWAACLVVGLVLMAAAFIAGITGWNRRVKDPLSKTKKTLKEDVQWAKERLA